MNPCCLLTSVDPVKATLSTSMCSLSAAPAVGPYPGIMFTTPGGNPTYWAEDMIIILLLHGEQKSAIILLLIGLQMG